MTLRRDDASAARLDPFVEATVEVFRTMADTEVRPVDATTPAPAGDLMATVGMTGDADGYVAVLVREGLARTFVSRVTGIEPREVLASDLRDGVGECANMIAGSAKAALAQEGFSLRLSLPVVEASPAGKTPAGAAVRVFDAEGEPFSIHVGWKDHRKG